LQEDNSERLTLCCRVGVVFFLLYGAVFNKMSILGLTRQIVGSISRVLPLVRRTLPVTDSTPACLSLPPTQQTFYSSLTGRFSLPNGSVTGSLLQTVRGHNIVAQRTGANFAYMHRTGIYKKVKKKRNHPLEGRPQLRGVVLKTLIKKPKKPNSANRKCVRLRLSTGREVIAYVPGEGHNLQEHNTVLVQGGRLQDTPGVKLVCVRGKYDLPHVKKKWDTLLT